MRCNRCIGPSLLLALAILAFPHSTARGQVSCDTSGTACEPDACATGFDVYPDRENPLHPISDLSAPDYEINGCTFEAGKYPGRTNDMPAFHMQAGLSEGRHVVPRDAAGRPDPINGLIGVMSIGNSNVAQEFDALRNEHIAPLMSPDFGGLSDRLVFVNGGMPGRALCDWAAEPDLESIGNPWGNIFLHQLQLGRQPGQGSANILVSPLQIQVVWTKGHTGRFLDICQGLNCGCYTDLCGPPESLSCDPPGPPMDLGAGAGCHFPNWAFDPQDGAMVKLKTVLTTAREVFPNLRQVYISNRLYSGYAGDFDSCAAISPEPWAYENGYMVKALIGQQIDGLMPFGRSGPFPWIAWGPEFWGNGALAGWFCYHVCADGIHPSSPEVVAQFGYPESGQSKLAGVLMDFFQTDAVVAPWFLAAGRSSCEGDANGDGTVDPLDGGFVLARFGCEVGTGDPACDAADVNGDGVIDPLDIGFVLARFGECP